MNMTSKMCASRPDERGNVLFMILLAVVLIGLLTAAVLRTNRPEGANIDKEALIIRASEAQRAASEFERGILFIVQQNGKSESTLRFAHPQAHTDYGDLPGDTDKSDQLFDKSGGGATYREAPPEVNDGSKWEFFGGTALPEVGSDKADLIAVLPNVTQAFCTRVNELNGQTSQQPLDDDDCLNPGASGRFDNGTQFETLSPNTVDESTFTKKPALQACVKCDDNTYQFYHVLLAR